MSALNWIKENFLELVVAVVSVAGLFIGAFQVVQGSIDKVDNRLAGEIDKLEEELNVANKKIDALEDDGKKFRAALNELQDLLWEDFRETCRLRRGRLVSNFKICDFPDRPDLKPLTFRLRVIKFKDPLSDFDNIDSEENIRDKEKAKR